MMRYLYKSFLWYNLRAWCTLIYPALCLCTYQHCAAQDMKTYGVKINVADMQQAYSFYVDKLGFKVIAGNDKSEFLFLNGGNEKDMLIIKKVRNLIPEASTEARAILTIQVNNLDSSIMRMKRMGVDFGEERKRKEGVGFAIFCRDPFGTEISVMQITVEDDKRVHEPVVYNYGYRISDMDKSRTFYRQFGFIEKTDRYLPLDMPLYNADSSFSFMLHYRENIEPVTQNAADNEHTVILFKTENIQMFYDKYKSTLRFIQKSVMENDYFRYISFSDPDGYISEVIETKNR